MSQCTSIKAILFDFSGVLAEEGYISGLTALALQHALNPKDFVTEATRICYESGYADGRAPASVFWQGVRDAFPIRLSDEALHEAILSRFIIRPAMLAEVDALRHAGFTTAIVSDHTDWLEMLDERHAIFNHFDFIFTSYHEKCNKRTGELFDVVKARMPYAPHEMLFFDDNAGNIERASNKGFITQLFTTHEVYQKKMKERFSGIVLASPTSS